MKLSSIRLALVLLIMQSGHQLHAQNPTYLLKIANEVLTSPNTYEFDVFIVRTGNKPLELANLSMGIGIDISTINGGKLSATVLPSSSELNSMQTPSNVMMATVNSTATVAHCGSCQNTGITFKYIKVSSRSNPGAGSGTLISNKDNGCNHPGTKVARFKITNTVNFAPNSKMNIVWSAGVSPGQSNTVVSAYIGTVATAITDTANHLNYNAKGSCAINPVLNASRQ